MKRRTFLMGLGGALVGIPGVILLKDAVDDLIIRIYDARHPRPSPDISARYPNHIVLTWAGDPRHSQQVQWRTGPKFETGKIQYRPLGQPEQTVETQAVMLRLEDENILNDPVNHRFSAPMEGLQPDTAYEYRVGHADPETWSEWATFTTAPAGTPPFSFVYWGDVQRGYQHWGRLVKLLNERYPHAAFDLFAGDLVNRGNFRNEWDAFFRAAGDRFRSRVLVPALGNHEYPSGQEPWLYHKIFTLPENGPQDIPAQRAYSFTYSNALYIILDSNLSPAAQRPWLEEQLAGSDATWKFVMYHHPAYASRRARDNREVRGEWGPLFDKYHVDIAFQGHDHAYLRTEPMFNNEPVGSPAEGTIYLTSVAGTKFYDQEPLPFAVKEIEETTTYQVLDIDGNRLHYRAYDDRDTLRDEFFIEK